MPTIHLRRPILLFWSAMDAFYVCFLIISSVRRGDVPFWSDLNAALVNMQNWGGGLEVLVWLGWITQLSVVVSGVLFYLGCRRALHLALVQIPFRVLFIVPSIALIVLIPDLSAGLWLGLLMLSEAVKGWSLWWLWRNWPAYPLRGA